MIETHKRTIARTITYRIIATAITAYWVGFGDAISIHIVLTIVQYILERIWLKIKWGQIKDKDKA